MKILFFLVMWTLTMSICAQTLEFKENEHDFGIIREDEGLVTFDFTYENRSKAVIKIEDIKSSCGCTIPKWKEATVKPGEKGLLPVSFDPEGRPGKFSKTVSVYINTMAEPVKLFIKGNVLAGLSQFKGELGPVKVSDNEVSFGNLKNTQQVTEVLEFFNPTENICKISISSKSKGLSVNSPSFILKANSSQILEISLDAKSSEKYGYWKDDLKITITSDNNVSTHIIPVNYIIEEDFSKYTYSDKLSSPQIVLPEKEYLFGEAKKGSTLKKDFRIINKGKSNLYIRRIQDTKNIEILDYPHVLKPGEEGKIKINISFNSKNDLFLRSLTIISNDPANSSSSIKIKGKVK